MKKKTNQSKIYKVWRRINLYFLVLDLSKDLIGNNSLKKSLINIFNTNRKINQLYRHKILSEQNNKNIDMMIINQEKEL